jgi:hypothetical protein
MAQKRVSYNARAKQVQEKSMDEGQMRKELESTWEELRRYCVICWLLHDIKEEEHLTSDCIELRLALGSEYAELRAQHLNYKSGTCCYTCGRPGDMCEEFSTFGLCKNQDMVVPTVLMAWLNEELDLRAVISEVAEREFSDAKSFFNWLGTKRRVLGMNESNAFAVFEAIVRKRRPRRSVNFFT